MIGTFAPGAVACWCIAATGGGDVSAMLIQKLNSYLIVHAYLVKSFAVGFCVLDWLDGLVEFLGLKGPLEGTFGRERPDERSGIVLTSRMMKESRMVLVEVVSY